MARKSEVEQEEPLTPEEEAEVQTERRRWASLTPQQQAAEVLASISAGLKCYYECFPEAARDLDEETKRDLGLSDS